MSIRDLEKYTKYFVRDSIQIVVESRLGGGRIKTKCVPTGNTWFNLCLNDIKDVNEQTLKCLDSLKCKTFDSSFTGFTVKASWKLCCEISLKTNEDESMVLEYWYIENTCSNDVETRPDSNVATSPTSAASTMTTTTSSPPSSSMWISEIYNRMSLMLNSLITITRATPAYRISRRQGADSYIICYRVYQVEPNTRTVLDGGGVASEEDLKHFTPETKLGVIQSKENTVTVSFSYRLNMTKTYKESGNGDLIKAPELLPVKNDHFQNEKPQGKPVDINREAVKQNVAAFASPTHTSTAFPLLPEAPFASLLVADSNTEQKTISNGQNNKEPAQNNVSKPIEIPEKLGFKKHCNGTPPHHSSSADSFVFVELKAPFASDDQNDLGSFFNGPSPTFTTSGDLSEELTDISSRLAILETNGQQWDTFVDSICCPDPEEFEKE